MTPPPDSSGRPESVVFPDGLRPDEVLRRLGGAGAPFVDVRPGAWDATGLIDSALGALAETALEEWPSWFDTGEGAGPSPLESVFSFDAYTSDIFRVIHRAARVHASDPGWLKAAVTIGVFRGRPPFFPDAPAEIQARQLPLVLGGKYRVLRIFPPGAKAPAPGGLTGFAKGCEWLAGETGMKVLALIPDALKESPELAPVMYKPRSLPGPGETLFPEGWPEGPAAAPDGPAGSGAPVSPEVSVMSGVSGISGSPASAEGAGSPGGWPTRGAPQAPEGNSALPSGHGAPFGAGMAEGGEAPEDSRKPERTAGANNGQGGDAPATTFPGASEGSIVRGAGGTPWLQPREACGGQGGTARPSFLEGLGGILDNVAPGHPSRPEGGPLGGTAGLGGHKAVPEAGFANREDSPVRSTASPGPGPGPGTATGPPAGNDPVEGNASPASRHPYGGPFRPFWDIEGRPNPLSPGESVLAERLKEAPDLAGLFAFNVAVETEGGARFVVDLLWEEGRLAIEIDGYAHHSSKQAFAADRERDFQLMLSGYRVVRIPHGEAFWSADEAVDKIRKAVEYVRGKAD